METKIIKSSSGFSPSAGAMAPVRSKIVKKEVYDANLRARELVETAQRQALAIRDQAEQERNVILESARQQGYQEGLLHWNQALAAAAQAQEKLHKDWEEELLRLSVRIAEKVIGEQLRSDPETIVRIVREALKSVRQERSLTISVNPQHLEVVRLRLDRLQEVVGTVRSISVVPKPSVAPGGCVVESELGVIDAQLEIQLKCLEEALLRKLKK